MAQVGEPSITDYARFYGLIRDHLEPHPLQGIAASLSLTELDDPLELVQVDFAKFKTPEERLTVDAGAATLLSSITDIAKQAPSRIDDGIPTHRVRQMKHELPLLRSDHELDMLAFAPQIIPDLQHEFLPLETVDEEADEGLTWPSKFYNLPDTFAKKSASEKLQVSSDAFLFLQSTLTFHLEGGDHEAFEHNEQPYKSTKVRPVSPPLLPLSPTPQPFVPSSETGRLDLLSDHTSPTREEARNVERMMFDEDAIINPEKEPGSSSPCSDPMLLDSESLGDIYSPLKGIKDPPSSPPPRRPPFQDRKVEVPLSPAKSERPPLWKRKSVSFSEALPELIPDLPLPIPKPEDTSSSDIDAFFEEAIVPIGIKAERTIEQEQLQEEDTTLRATGPIMDFSLPIPPWKTCTTSNASRDANDLYKKTLTEMKALHFSNDPLKKHVWPTNGKAERELKWAPFPAALGKIETYESIPDDGSLGEYLAQPERLNIDTLTWKPDGLRILDDLAESDEELEEGTFPEESNMESLIRKRKLELDLEGTSPSSDENFKLTKARPLGERGTSSGHSEARRVNQKKVLGAQTNPHHGESVTDNFSAMDALNDFLSIRKGFVEKPKPKVDRHFPEILRDKVQQASPKQESGANLESSGPKPLVMPSPTTTAPKTPCQFVLSAFFLSNRTLSRQIQSLFPTAEFIERDFNLHLDPPQRPQSKSNIALPVISTLADDADIILSPSTGLICTTLQKIKQRSLPGQVARSAVRERILAISPRYERLFVMVSEGLHAGDPVGTGHLDNSDCEALIEFIAFCSSLPDEVTVTFIAGAEKDLAKWIVAMMVKYGVSGQAVKLIQDETLWEIFLRRAGMNAFAAQAILGKLKKLEQHGREDDEFGLTAFVEMSLEERLARFETLLGGRRVLGRVSRVLDARW